MARRDSTPAPQVDQPDSALIRHWLGRARAAGNYFTVFRPFYRILSKLDALFLCDLLNVQGMSRSTPDGYFLCTNRRMESFGWTVNEQKMRWPALIEAGLVRTEKRGSPPLRWVFIDLFEIERRLDAAPPLPDAGPGDDDPDDHSSGFPTIDPHSSARLTNDRQPKSQPFVSQTDAIKETPSVFLQGEGKEGEGNPKSPPSDSDSGNPRQRRAAAAPAADQPQPPARTPPAPRAAPAAPQDEQDPGLFPPAAGVKTTDQDTRRAARLRAHAVNMGWKPATARNDWGPELGVLRRELEKAGDPPDLIDRVLDEYITRRIDKPTIKSGRELRVQWDWVLRMTGMDRPPAPVVTPAAQAVADLVRTRAWSIPPADVAALAQMSMAAVAAFRKQLDAYPWPPCRRTGGPNGLHRALACALGDAPFQATRHLREVADNLSGRRDPFRGPVDTLAWSPDRGAFDREARKACQDWGHLAGWPALLAEIRGAA